MEAALTFLVGLLQGAVDRSTNPQQREAGKWYFARRVIGPGRAYELQTALLEQIVNVTMASASTQGSQPMLQMHPYQPQVLSDPRLPGTG